MKRRAFIGGGFNIMSLALLSKSMIYAHSETPVRQNVLENFISQFKFELTRHYWADSSFNLLYTETSKCFQKTPYKLFNRHIYSSLTSNLLVVPLQLHIAETGVEDWCFLFYEKGKNGQWQYVKTLNKYEIQAVTALVGTISNKHPNENPAEWLLPCFQQESSQQHNYSTPKGRVQVIVKLDTKNIQTEVQVWNDRHQIL